MVSVRLEKIGKSFPKSGPVLDSISLELTDGVFLSLLGPSGSGKTTLLRILSGLESSDCGKIEFIGPRSSGDVAFVFQEPALLPWLTVEENIGLPVRLLNRQLTETDLDSVIKLVSLDGARLHLPDELSGGMKMRVSLARALVTRPKFLFLDEPFAALDEVTRLELEEELSVITHDLRMTTVLVTHSITEAVFLSDRILLLSARSHRIDREMTCPVPRPRTSQFRSDPVYSQFVQDIRGQFSGLGRTR